MFKSGRERGGGEDVANQLGGGGEFLLSLNTNRRMNEQRSIAAVE